VSILKNRYFLEAAMLIVYYSVMGELQHSEARNYEILVVILKQEKYLVLQYLEQQRMYPIFS